MSEEEARRGASQPMQMPPVAPPVRGRRGASVPVMPRPPALPMPRVADAGLEREAEKGAAISPEPAEHDPVQLSPTPSRGEPVAEQQKRVAELQAYVADPEPVAEEEAVTILPPPPTLNMVPGMLDPLEAQALRRADTAPAAVRMPVRETELTNIPPVPTQAEVGSVGGAFAKQSPVLIQSPRAPQLASPKRRVETTLLSDIQIETAEGPKERRRTGATTIVAPSEDIPTPEIRTPTRLRRKDPRLTVEDLKLRLRRSLVEEQYKHPTQLPSPARPKSKLPLPRRRIIPGARVHTIQDVTPKSPKPIQVPPPRLRIPPKTKVLPKPVVRTRTPPPQRRLPSLLTAHPTPTPVPPKRRVRTDQTLYELTKVAPKPTTTGPTQTSVAAECPPDTNTRPTQAKGDNRHENTTGRTHTAVVAESPPDTNTIAAQAKGENRQDPV